MDFSIRLLTHGYLLSPEQVREVGIEKVGREYEIAVFYDLISEVTYYRPLKQL